MILPIAKHGVTASEEATVVHVLQVEMSKPPYNHRQALFVAFTRPALQIWPTQLISCADGKPGKRSCGTLCRSRRPAQGSYRVPG